MRLLGFRKTDRVSNWMLWRWMEIDGRKPGVKYLTRLYVVQTPWFGIKLHIFHAPDPDDACHDHPWSFLSVLLRGAYQERRQFLHEAAPGRFVLLRQTEEQRRGFLNLALRRAEAIHRITMVVPGSVTLIFNGPKRKSWGFMKQVGANIMQTPLFKYVPWREYLRVPASTPEV